MDFTIAVPVTPPPDAVLDAFLDPAFLAATATLPGIGGGEVLELTRTATTARLRARYRFTGTLNRAVTRVVDPDRLTWVDDATFDLAAGRATHTLVPDHYPDRLEAAYVSTVDAVDTGSVWTVTGTLVVRAPVVGGRVAGVVVGGFDDHARARGRLLDAWWAERNRAPGDPG